jgi:hypothetical protein
MEVKKQGHIHIRRRFAALKNSDDIGDFKSLCENVTENIQILI